MFDDAEILKGVIPIQRKFLQRNQLFALEVREGFLFGRVIRRRITQWKPYPVINANGIDVDLAPSSAQAEIRFVDPRNVANALLFLSTTTGVGLPWFFHGAFGIDPQYINMYLRYPEGGEIPGKFPNVTPIRPVAGDNISPLNSLVSPYEQPTDYHECIILPTKHIGAEYYNRHETWSHQPVLNILFCLYWVQLFNSESHPTLIADIALKRYEGAKASFLQHGFGDQPEEIGPEVQKDWKITPLTLDEASSLGGGR
jgi:hypothetical protein